MDSDERKRVSEHPGGMMNLHKQQL